MARTKGTGPSPTYSLFAQAMAEHKQILCTHHGCRRELCPIVLGRRDGQEVALTWQFAGEGKGGLRRGGDWRCLYLAEISDVRLRDGPWHQGASHEQPQSCVEIVDLDVNPASPYKPRRRLD